MTFNRIPEEKLVQKDVTCLCGEEFILEAETLDPQKGFCPVCGARIRWWPEDNIAIIDKPPAT